MPLAERRRRLLAIDWVEDASVSRVWPDRLVIRIRERRPVAFVSSGPARCCIDAQGVLLEQPAQAQFSYPVLSECAKGRPKPIATARVRTFLQVQEEMGYLAKQISERRCLRSDNHPHRFPGGPPRGDPAPGRRQLRAALVRIFSITIRKSAKARPRRRCSICGWMAASQ